VLVAVAAVFLWLRATRTFEPWLLGVISLLFFMAAMPWVNVLKPSRVFGSHGSSSTYLVATAGDFALS
jgi:Na+-transporting methylmalonyl-CoA/oxaloacetate decarboxylase beta subunit